MRFSVYSKLLIFVGISILVLLCFVNPEEAIWMPKCIFRSFTGLECPACGSQRAVYHLLHFRFLKAIHYNFFLLISIPYLILLGGAVYLRSGGRFGKIKNFVYHQVTVNVFLILLISWWILRNVLGI